MPNTLLELTKQKLSSEIVNAVKNFDDARLEAILLNDSALEKGLDLKKISMNSSNFLDTINIDGTPIIHFIAQHLSDNNFVESINILRILAAQGANMNLPYPGSPLQCLIWNFNKSLTKELKLEFANELINLGANVNFQNPNNGYTPLHHSVNTNQAELFNLLVQRGADTEQKNQAGYRPIQSLFLSQSKELVSSLIANCSLEDLFTKNYSGGFGPKFVNSQIFKKLIENASEEDFPVLMKKIPNLQELLLEGMQYWEKNICGNAIFNVKAKFILKEFANQEGSDNQQIEPENSVHDASNDYIVSNDKDYMEITPAGVLPEGNAE
ncbi:MAG: hypothetical protein K0Q51_1501 [Rickettsiaceae bacterium]|jgi:ankyrin repeat protein|nr:hypothetical protein [Rickettsiaceae bacterium]